MLSIFSLAILKFISWLIHIYQYTLSPDHGPFKSLFPSGVCRHIPTCSEYAQQAIKLHGGRGLILTYRRLLRCHPFSRGGYDPIPLKPTHKS